MKIKYDFEKHEWEKLPPYSEEGFYTSPKLFDKCMNIKKIQKKGWDGILEIDGGRRVGKSTMGMTIGTILDPENFGIDSIIIGMDDAAEKIENAKEESVLLMDEGVLALSSKDAMKKAHKKLDKIIQIMGQKRLILIIILPSFFELLKSIAVTHSLFLIHCYASPTMERGYFCYFNTKQKKILYEYGKKHYGSYKYPEAEFEDRFIDFQYPFKAEYLKLKKKSLLEALRIDVEDGTGANKFMGQRDMLLSLINKKRWLTQLELSDYLTKMGYPLTNTAISKICLRNRGKI